jgi:hypothetical protein
MRSSAFRDGDARHEKDSVALLLCGLRLLQPPSAGSLDLVHSTMSVWGWLLGHEDEFRVARTEWSEDERCESVFQLRRIGRCHDLLEEPFAWSAIIAQLIGAGADADALFTNHCTTLAPLSSLRVVVFVGCATGRASAWDAPACGSPFCNSMIQFKLHR